MGLIAKFLLSLAFVFQIIGHSNAAEPEMKSIKVGLAAQAPVFLPIYLADTKGLFEEEGLEVEIIHFRSGPDIARGLISGALTYAAGAPEEVLLAQKAGQDVKAFYAGMNTSAYDWYAVPSVKSISESKGMRYGISAVGSVSDTITRYALKHSGLDPDNDVQIIPGGSSAARVSAMEAGQLDVNILIPPAKFTAAARGFNKIFSLADITPDYPYEVIYAAMGTLQDNPNTTRALLRAFSKAVELAKTDREASIQELQERLGIERPFAEQSYEEAVGQFYADGRLPSEKAMDVFWEITTAGGVYTERLEESQWFDRTFLDTYSQWIDE